MRWKFYQYSPKPVHTEDRYGETPLYKAIECMRILLQLGAPKASRKLHANVSRFLVLMRATNCSNIHGPLHSYTRLLAGHSHHLPPAPPLTELRSSRVPKSMPAVTPSFKFKFEFTTACSDVRRTHAPPTSAMLL